MRARLTITVDEDVILRAKGFAKKHGKSLSSLIENFLKIAAREEVDETTVSKKIKKLKGSVKVPQDFDYKTELSRVAYEKYIR